MCIRDRPLLADPRLPLQPRTKLLRAAVGGALQWSVSSWAVSPSSFGRLASFERRCAAALHPVARRVGEELGEEEKKGFLRLPTTDRNSILVVGPR
eukprot:3914822-Amphidinium_carterae.1